MMAGLPSSSSFPSESGSLQTSRGTSLGGARWIADVGKKPRSTLAEGEFRLRIGKGRLL